MILCPWVVLGNSAVSLALYVAVLHPRLMNRGATGAEQRMALPGDEVAVNEARGARRRGIEDTEFRRLAGAG